VLASALELRNGGTFHKLKTNENKQHIKETIFKISVGKLEGMGPVEKI
jgi:hypothetical protein